MVSELCWRRWKAVIDRFLGVEFWEAWRGGFSGRWGAFGDGGEVEGFDGYRGGGGMFAAAGEGGEGEGFAVSGADGGER